MRLAILCLVALSALPTPGRAQVPVFEAAPVDSAIKFYVKASVALVGNFDKWDATLTFASRDVTTGVLDIKIQAATVSTGSGIKDKNSRAKTSSTSNRTHDHLSLDQSRADRPGHI
jgi:polyisoprenoid-binding protein YceI